jgi:hypothetical protein
MAEPKEYKEAVVASDLFRKANTSDTDYDDLEVNVCGGELFETDEDEITTAKSIFDEIVEETEKDD